MRSTRWRPVVLAVALTGCGAPSAPEPSPPTPAPAPPAPTGPGGRPAAARHAHEAPHGGTLVELGDGEAHLELVVDPDAGQMILYVLDGTAERDVRIAQPAVNVLSTTRDVSAALQLSAVGSLATGERAGDTSEFRGASDTLRGASRVDVRIESVTVRGQTYDNVRAAWTGGAS